MISRNLSSNVASSSKSSIHSIFLFNPTQNSVIVRKSAGSVKSEEDNNETRLSEWLDLDQVEDGIALSAEDAPKQDIHHFDPIRHHHDHQATFDQSVPQINSPINHPSFASDYYQDFSSILQDPVDQESNHHDLAFNPSVNLVAQELANPTSPFKPIILSINPSSLSQPSSNLINSISNHPHSTNQDHHLLSVSTPQSINDCPLDPALLSHSVNTSIYGNSPICNQLLEESSHFINFTHDQKIETDQKPHPTSDLNISTSNQALKRNPSHPHALVQVPDWDDKPSAEEYKLLSSKEKRQLRNKISARNFRHRRKEHISTLEQQLAQRDQTIENLCRDLNQARKENKELQSEIEKMKEKWSDLIKKIGEVSLGSNTLSSPSLNKESINSSFINQVSSVSNHVVPLSPRLKSNNKSNGVFPMPNLHKDLGSHSRKPFNGAGGMAGGNVGVHTTLIPDISINVYEEPSWEFGSLSLTNGSSPQALMESKHLMNQQVERTHHGDPTLAMNQRESNEELGMQLSQLLFEALRLGPDSNTIDEEKLRGCLEGRLGLRVVELSPPPYVGPTSIEIINRGMSGLQLGV
ncbi:hypothetical protein O181_060422 [Austropuccinia psidii MF-1]|uniref:BZIP domain-containing protein n=1 Tax=Austropuccinia psidii MF-1 TaxID=1389203 RepID=A0A9Q3HYE8_9BASI|nr:hypothetical protein [Austropuccinia psidii MF-1]